MPPSVSSAFRAIWCLATTSSLLWSEPVSAREDFYSELKPCPVSCSSTSSPNQWTLYDSLQRLTYCHAPIIFEVSLSGEKPLTRSELTRVRACTAADSESVVDTIVLPDDQQETASARQGVRRSMSCPTSSTQSTNPVQLASWGPRSSSATESRPALDLLEEIRLWVGQRTGCRQTPTLTFGHYNGTVVGYFAGNRVDDVVAATALIPALVGDISEQGVASSLLLQHCNVGEEEDSDITGGVTAGIVVAIKDPFTTVQRALRSWNQGKCVQQADDDELLTDLSLDLYPASTPEMPNSTRSNSGHIEVRQSSSDECRWIRAEDEDTCTTLAKRCGISGAQYMRFNSDDQYHCSTLAAGQAVCCSAGSRPDITPEPNEDGSCFVHTVDAGDTCSALARANDIRQDDLFKFNKKTWGWSGCDPLPLGISICLSAGSPPMPAAVDNAVCGPTKPGTRPPRGDQELSDLNPCPLKACCNIWGQCGTTADFCTVSESETGAPGTSAPDTHGCVQNCGTEIVNNGQAPEKFYKLGYFEGWNQDRPCLHMDVRSTKNHKQVRTFCCGSLDFGASFGQLRLWCRV